MEHLRIRCLKIYILLKGRDIDYADYKDKVATIFFSFFWRWSFVQTLSGNKTLTNNMFMLNSALVEEGLFVEVNNDTPTINIYNIVRGNTANRRLDGKYPGEE